MATHIIANRLAGISEQRIEEGLEVDPTSSSEEDGLTAAHDGSKTLGHELFRKYVAFAKRNISPVMEKSARQKITDYYVKTRLKGGESRDSVSITARALEALVRLAEASARVRLSNIATDMDADRAIRLTTNWRHLLMGDDFDETTMQSGIKTGKRNKTLEILAFITEENRRTNNVVELKAVLNFCEMNDFSANDVEDLLQDLVNKGTLFQPQGYGTYVPT